MAVASLIHLILCNSSHIGAGIYKIVLACLSGTYFQICRYLGGKSTTGMCPTPFVRPSSALRYLFASLGLLHAWGHEDTSKRPIRLYHPVGRVRRWSISRRPGCQKRQRHYFAAQSYPTFARRPAIHREGHSKGRSRRLLVDNGWHCLQ